MCRGTFFSSRGLLLASKLIEISCTELSLVVVIGIRREWLGFLGLLPLRVVLLLQTPHPGLRLWPFILQLQSPGLYRLWASPGHGGVFDGVRFCEENIWVSSPLLEKNRLGVRSWLTAYAGLSRRIKPGTIIVILNARALYAGHGRRHRPCTSCHMALTLNLEEQGRRKG